MDILQKFNEYVLINDLVNQGDRVLLAVSGGKDSMLMLWLFYHMGVEIEIAHCNFNLRAEESDKDEELVRKFAVDFNIPIHVQDFDTQSYAAEHKVSIQMAARELRYDWFEKLRIQRDCTCVAVAQHKNDHVETVLWNLVRGTGLKGLSGIRNKRRHVIRPLLFLDANQIAQLVQKYSIPYRNDMSNFLTKYSRNKIRLDIVPEFEKMNPDFINVMEDNIARFQESTEVLDDFVSKLRNEIFIQSDVDSWEIYKEAIKGNKIGLIYLLFEPFGFGKSTLESMLEAIDGESGRVFESEEYVLLCDRTQLFLKKKHGEVDETCIPDRNNAVVPWAGFSFECSVTSDCSIDLSAEVAKLDLDRLVFPLKIRAWKEGDVFQPLGMSGKKKISDLFIQLKINLFDKKSIPLVINGNGDIIWVAGFQIDDRYKITQKTKKVLKLVIHKR